MALSLALDITRRYSELFKRPTILLPIHQWCQVVMCIFTEKQGLSVPRYQHVYFSSYLEVSTGDSAVLPCPSYVFALCVVTAWQMASCYSWFTFPATWFPYVWILLRSGIITAFPLPSIHHLLQNTMILFIPRTCLFRFPLEHTFCAKTKSLTSSLWGKIEGIHVTILKPWEISVWYNL